VNGEVCPHFDPESVEVDRGCRLRAELGDWSLVYIDHRYPHDPDRIKCGEWPGAGKTCNECKEAF
jgi:hypothetical protein